MPPGLGIPPRTAFQCGSEPATPYGDQASRAPLLRPCFVKAHADQMSCCVGTNFIRASREPDRKGQPVNEVIECVRRANGSRESAVPTSARTEVTGSAKQSIPVHEAKWIASSQGLLAMRGKQGLVCALTSASRVQRMQPMRYRRATPRRSCLCSTYPRKTAGLPVRHRGRAHIDDNTTELALPLLRPA